VDFNDTEERDAEEDRRRPLFVFLFGGASASASLPDSDFESDVAEPSAVEEEDRELESTFMPDGDGSVYLRFFPSVVFFDATTEDIGAEVAVTAVEDFANSLSRS